MNVALRNFPKPPLAAIYGDCGLSARTDIVAQICNRTNEVIEYMLGMEAPQVLVPAQSNIDERMPLRFLRPCVEAINLIIFQRELEVDPVRMPGDSMDYHGFVPLARDITEALNKIIEVL